MSANSVESLMTAEYISMGMRTHISQHIKDRREGTNHAGNNLGPLKQHF